MAWPFLIWRLFRVVRSESMYIFAIGPFLSLSNSSPLLLIHSAFLLCSLGYHILLPFFFASLASSCWYVFAPYPLLVGRFIFRWFGMFCFVWILLSWLDFFFNFPSFSSTFWLIFSSCIVIFTCVAFFYLSKNCTSVFPLFFFFLFFFHFCLL